MYHISALETILIDDILHKNQDKTICHFKLNALTFKC